MTSPAPYLQPVDSYSLWLSRLVLLLGLATQAAAEARYSGEDEPGLRGVVVEVRFEGDRFILRSGDATLANLSEVVPLIEAGIKAGLCNNLIALDIGDAMTVAQLAYILLDFPDRYYLARSPDADPGERYLAARALISETSAIARRNAIERYGIPVDERLREFPGLYGEYLRLETRRHIARLVLDQTNGIQPDR